MQTHVDAPGSDDFGKHYDKRRNFKMFSNVFNYIRSYYIDKQFPYLCPDMYTVVCMRYGVCGKGVSLTSDREPHILTEN